MPLILTHGRLRQEDDKFHGTLRCIVRSRQTGLHSKTLSPKRKQQTNKQNENNKTPSKSKPMNKNS